MSSNQMSNNDTTFRGLTYAEEQAMDARLHAAKIQIVGVNYDMPPYDVLARNGEHLLISIGNQIYCLEQYEEGWLVMNETGYLEWKPSRLQWGCHEETFAESLYEALDIAIDDADYRAGLDLDDPDKGRKWTAVYEREHGDAGSGWQLRRVTEGRLAKKAEEITPSSEERPRCSQIVTDEELVARIGP